MTMLKIVVVFCSLILVVAGLGINCRGSSGCKGEPTLEQLNAEVQKLDDGRVYRSGEHIVCLPRGRGIISIINWRDGLCIFLQFAPEGTTITGSRVKQLIPQLMAHGCKGCGSIPINFPASNDPGPGILTTNYVSDTDNPCIGVC
uniref:Killer toxin Kp4 domain-containing protein n=1 Tax=Panagrolaimus sp. PS1159 TaxID=55785 RepID=A0AC35F9F4_9BILA